MGCELDLSSSSSLHVTIQPAMPDQPGLVSRWKACSNTTRINGAEYVLQSSLCFANCCALMRRSAACSQSDGGSGGMFTIAVVRHWQRPYHQSRNGKSEGRLATQCPRPARAFVVSLVVVGEEVAQVPRSGPSPNLPCKGLRMQGKLKPLCRPIG